MIGAITAGLFSTGVAPVTSSYESIATVTVGSGGQSTISFTSIPSTFKHLQIRASFATGETYGQMVGTFNSDTGSNYSRHFLYGTGAAAGSAGYSSVANWNAGYGATITTYPVASVIDILDYTNTNKYKTVRTLTGQDVNGSGGNIYMYSNAWLNTAAITRIDLTNASAINFAQYTSVALYGIKG
jgi:hypothetical protein